jgi:hypothetical protein
MGIHDLLYKRSADGVLPALARIVKLTQNRSLTGERLQLLMEGTNPFQKNESNPFLKRLNEPILKWLKMDSGWWTRFVDRPDNSGPGRPISAEPPARCGV